MSDLIKNYLLTNEKEACDDLPTRLILSEHVIEGITNACISDKDIDVELLLKVITNSNNVRLILNLAELLSNIRYQCFHRKYKKNTMSIDLCIKNTHEECANYIRELTEALCNCPEVRAKDIYKFTSLGLLYFKDIEDGKIIFGKLMDKICLSTDDTKSTTIRDCIIKWGDSNTSEIVNELGLDKSKLINSLCTLYRENDYNKSEFLVKENDNWLTGKYLYQVATYLKNEEDEDLNNNDLKLFDRAICRSKNMKYIILYSLFINKDLVTLIFENYENLLSYVISINGMFLFDNDSIFQDVLLEINNHLSDNTSTDRITYNLESYLIKK